MQTRYTIRLLILQEFDDDEDAGGALDRMPRFNGEDSR